MGSPRSSFAAMSTRMTRAVLAVCVLVLASRAMPLLADGTPVPDSSRERSRNVSPKAELAFYASQSVVTDPGEHADMYADLPSEVSELCKVVQGSLIHVFHAFRHGVSLTEEQKKDAGIRRVEEMLERIGATDSRPLRFAREPDQRLAANCRGYAVLLTSLLRHKGVAARARCGFAGYFSIPGSGWYDEHWVCQYWNGKERRWVWVDPQVDDPQREAFHIDFNTYDMPAGKFLPAGETWALAQSGKIDPDHCGIGELHGQWFIGDDVARDFMALNKLELLPWDWTQFMTARKGGDMSADEKRLLDRLAALGASPDTSFAELRDLYKQDNPMFRMPKGWEP
jgi:hypothetical protein